MTDAVDGIVETPTYCKPNDEFRPVVAQSLLGPLDVCPADLSQGVDEVTNAYPDGWYVRIMFDELLDPNIEELTEIIDEDTGEPTDTYTASIANTHPVKLECESVTGSGMVEVDYDGYYSPSGNRITWPLGPALVIKPNDPTLIATNTDCQLTILDSVVDKSGEAVPSDQRGPYKFKVAPIEVLATDPEDSDEVGALGPYYDNFYFQFNTDVDVSSFCADTDSGGTPPGFADLEAGAGLCDEGTETFSIDPPVTAADAGGFWGLCAKGTLADLISGDAYCSTDADCAGMGDRCDQTYAYTYSGESAGTEIGIGYTTPLKTETEYTFSLNPGIKLKDRCGKETELASTSPDDLTVIRFVTAAFDLDRITPETGETAAMVKKPTMKFNTVVDVTSLDANEFSIEPAPAALALGQSASSGDIIIGGNYAPDTQYTFTLKAGATVEDFYGAVYTNDADKTVTWKTAAKVVLTTTTTDGSTLTKSYAGQLLGVALNFNANMDVATLTTADFTFVNSAGDDVTALASFTIGNGASSASCSATSQSCQLRIRADLPPDDYTFTLKSGATISDKLGNEYMQPADKVIKFTVKAAVPTPAIQCL